MTNGRLKEIPRGNTCPGVNRAVIEHILKLPEIRRESNLLDVPCGNGEFLDAVNLFVPAVKTYGIDIATAKPEFAHDFIQANLSTLSSLDLTTKFDLVTCISGVMEFDNTLAFFERIRELICQDGEFIVTNDNLLSIRDRITYLLFGRFWQYRFSSASGETTWKILTITNLVRILSDAGFEVEEIKYVSPKWIEWFWLPLAAPIFAFQKLSPAIKGASGSNRDRLNMLPFISLLSRHYILFCRPMIAS